MREAAITERSEGIGEHVEAPQRLYVTIAPVLVGDGVPGLRLPGQARMREALLAAAREGRADARTV